MPAGAYAADETGDGTPRRHTHTRSITEGCDYATTRDPHGRNTQSTIGADPQHPHHAWPRPVRTAILHKQNFAVRSPNAAARPNADHASPGLPSTMYVTPAPSSASRSSTRAATAATRISASSCAPCRCAIFASLHSSRSSPRCNTRERQTAARRVCPSRSSTDTSWYAARVFPRTDARCSRHARHQLGNRNHLVTRITGRWYKTAMAKWRRPRCPGERGRLHCARPDRANGGSQAKEVIP